MSVEESTTTGIPVTLLRMGVGKQEMTLPEGATLADLLRATGITSEDVQIHIDGKELAERLTLDAGTIVSVIPREPKSPEYPPWKAGMGMFHDNPLFDEVMNAVEAARQAEKDLP